MKCIFLIVIFGLLSLQSQSQVSLKIQEEVSFNAFFASPLKSIRINSGKESCFSSNSQLIMYSKANNDTLEISFLFSSERFQHKIALQEVSALLKNTIANFKKFPKIEDFQITETDLEAYIQFIDTLNIDENRKELYKSFSNKINDIDSLAVKKILKMNKAWHLPSTSYGFSIVFTNEDGNILMAKSRYYEKPSLMLLPWHISYKGEEFESYDINLTTFLDKNTPKAFGNKSSLTSQKSILIYNLAMYCQHFRVDK